MQLTIEKFLGTRDAVSVFVVVNETTWTKPYQVSYGTAYCAPYYSGANFRHAPEFGRRNAANDILDCAANEGNSARGCPPWRTRCFSVGHVRVLSCSLNSRDVRTPSMISHPGTTLMLLDDFAHQKLKTFTLKVQVSLRLLFERANASSMLNAEHQNLFFQLHTTILMQHSPTFQCSNSIPKVLRKS